jgi:DNA-binding NarL/FixJ family response regulator
VRDLNQRYGGRMIMDRLEAMEAMAWLGRGHLERAELWAATQKAREQGGTNDLGNVDIRLALIRVDLATGNAVRARDMLADLTTKATRMKRWSDLVALHTWQAVTLQALGDHDGADGALRTALTYGMRGRFVRSLLTPGHDLSSCFTRLEATLTGADGAYLRHIQVQLGMRSNPSTIPHMADRPARDRHERELQLPHTLSNRELDVLALLELGLTNQEIADRLFLSHATAKKHVASILRKLGVPNRTSAVHWFQRARMSVKNDPGSPLDLA